MNLVLDESGIGMKVVLDEIVFDRNNLLLLMTRACGFVCAQF